MNLLEVEDLNGKEPNRGVNPDEAVAYGATVQAFLGAAGRADNETRNHSKSSERSRLLHRRGAASRHNKNTLNTHHKLGLTTPSDSPHPRTHHAL